jgi:hypothetical protein
MITSLSYVLPQVGEPSDARKLVMAATDGSKQALLQIKGAFGQTIKPMFGLYNGFYQLDLSKDLHRSCLSRLFENSTRRNGERAATYRDWFGHGLVGDTGQYPWNSFRNAMFNREPIEVTPANFTPMPVIGKLEFDFSTVERPWQIEQDIRLVVNEQGNRSLLGNTKETTGNEVDAFINPDTISDTKFVRILRSIGLLSNIPDDNSNPENNAAITPLTPMNHTTTNRARSRTSSIGLGEKDKGIINCNSRVGSPSRSRTSSPTSFSVMAASEGDPDRDADDDHNWDLIQAYHEQRLQTWCDDRYVV